MIPRGHRPGAFLAALALIAVPRPASGQMRPKAHEVQIMRYARQMQYPVNSGMPDYSGFVFCRLRYERARRQRKSGWWDDYPASDYNFLERFEELTTIGIARWANGDPGFAQVAVEDPDLYKCPFIKMQNAADAEFSAEEADRLHDYFLKGGFLWMDDNWTDEDWAIIKRNLLRIVPEFPIVELQPDHPLFSILYHMKGPPQIPSIESWRRSGGRPDEFGAGPPRLYAIFGPNGKLMVLVSINSDTSDSWEREGDNPDFFFEFSGEGYAMGVNLVLWVMSH